MSKEFTGHLNAKGQKVALVVSRFNSLVTEQLVSGAKDTFIRLGGNEQDLAIVHVPGAFELPAVAEKLIKSGGFDGLLILGALIKGSTLHFELLSQSVTQALVNLSTNSKIPIAFGLLATLNLDQALERAGLKGGNKGAETMLSLIETMNLMQNLP